MAINRTTMHIMLDAQLEIVQSSKFNKLDDPVKDIFLNTVISQFVDETIGLANPNKDRTIIQLGSLSHEAIKKKYNNIHTLIVRADLTGGVNVNDRYMEYDLPTSTPIYKFEGSFSTITLPCRTGESVVLPNILPTTVDVETLLYDPFATKQLMPTSISNSKFQVYHLNKYTVTSTTVIYLRPPARLAPNVNCDLPDNVHDEIVQRAVRLISASGNNPNFQPLLIENKNIEQ